MGIRSPLRGTRILLTVRTYIQIPKPNEPLFYRAQRSMGSYRVIPFFVSKMVVRSRKQLLPYLVHTDIYRQRSLVKAPLYRDLATTLAVHRLLLIYIYYLLSLVSRFDDLGFTVSWRSEHRPLRPSGPRATSRPSTLEPNNKYTCCCTSIRPSTEHQRATNIPGSDLGGQN